MTVFNVAVFAAIIYAQIATAFNDSEHEALKVQINDAKHAKEFSTLLNSIVNVNKERYDTLKKMTRLQQFPPYPPRNALRDGESDDSSEDTDEDSGPEIVAYLVLPEEDPTPRASDGSGSEDDDTGTYPRSRLTRVKKNKKTRLSRQKMIIRPRVKMAINETMNDPMSDPGVKKCTKACRQVQKQICSYYICDPELEKEFKKLCKKHCKEQFTIHDSIED